MERTRPTTDAYSEMKRGCMPKFTRWFEHCVTVEFPEKWVGNKIRNSDIFIEYQAWLPDRKKFQVEPSWGERVSKNGARKSDRLWV